MQFKLPIMALLAGIICSLISFSSLANEQQCSDTEIYTLAHGIKSFSLFDSACKPLPTDKSKTLASIIIQDSDESNGNIEDGAYIWRVMLLDSKTHQILATYEDSIYEDATIRVPNDCIWLDTAPYQLADNNRAFGVRLAIGYSANGTEAGQNDYLTLFSGNSDKGQLQPIVQSLPMSYWKLREGMPSYMDGKRWVIERAKASIQILPTSHNGLHDLLVSSTGKEEINEGEQSYNGKKRHYKTILKFDGKIYPFDEWSDIPSKNWYKPHSY